MCHIPLFFSWSHSLFPPSIVWNPGGGGGWGLGACKHLSPSTSLPLPLRIPPPPTAFIQER